MTAGRRTRRGAGMTLIEVMVAMSILGLMMMIAWGTTRQTLDAKRQYEKIQDRYREVRNALNRIVDDLSQAYVSGNEDRNVMDPRTQFVGESSGDIDTLVFSSFAHRPLYADANESDQTVISYFPAADAEDRAVTNLMRRELRRPPTNASFDTGPGETEIALTGVTRFKLTYWDVPSREWKETWSTQQTDGNAPRVPDRVRIVLGFTDERGKEITFTTEARIHVQETLSFYAN